MLLTESMPLHIVNDGLISINSMNGLINPFLVKEDFYRFYIRRQPRGQTITKNREVYINSRVMKTQPDSHDIRGCRSSEKLMTFTSCFITWSINLKSVIVLVRAMDELHCLSDV